jgi:hypothetical protein
MRLAPSVLRLKRFGALPPMNRNTLILIIGALVVAVGVLGYLLYDAKKEPTGVQINVGKDGIKIEQK